MKQSRIKQNWVDISTSGIKMALAITLVVGLWVGYTSSVSAKDAQASSETNARQSPYYYYSDGRRRQLWLQSNLIAAIPYIPVALAESEYRRRIDPGHSLRIVGALFNDVEPMDQDGGIVRLYRTGDDISRGSTNIVDQASDGWRQPLTQVNATNDFSFSAVFTFSRNSKSYVAFTGGVFVKFNEDWNPGQIQRWLAGRDLDRYGSQELMNKLYLIHTPVGVRSLAIANEIQESGEVTYAEPNMWQPMGTR